jgi:hypothetical protein
MEPCGSWPASPIPFPRLHAPGKSARFQIVSRTTPPGDYVDRAGCNCTNVRFRSKNAEKLTTAANRTVNEPAERHRNEDLEERHPSSSLKLVYVGLHLQNPREKLPNSEPYQVNTLGRCFFPQYRLYLIMNIISA